MYRVVDTIFWTDPRVRLLPPEAKLLFLYCITNTHTHVSGIYYLPDVVVEHETGLPRRGIDTLWDTLSGAGLLLRDKNSEVVWVKNMLRYQGRGAKIISGVVNHLKGLHKCSLIKAFVNHYPDVKKRLGEYPIDTPSEVGSVCLQEQEQEQEQEEKSLPRPRTRQRTSRDDLFDVVVELTGVDPKTAGSGVGKVVTALLAATPPYSPDEVRKLPAAIAATGLSFTLTPSAVQKYIGWVRTPPARTPGTQENGHASRGAGNGVGPTSRVRAQPGKYDGVGITIHSTAGAASQPAPRPPAPPAPDGGGAGPPDPGDLPFPRVG